MQGSMWRALAVAGLCAGIFAGAAFAANTRSFADPASDAGTAPDLVNIAVSNDDAGTVTAKVTLANRSTMGSNEGVGLGLDADQNPDTGSVFYGVEYELDFENGTASFYRASTDGFLEQAPIPASFHASFSDGVVTLTFQPSELGVASGFNLYGIGFNTADLDFAPDIRVVNYQLSTTTTPPVLQPDHRAPLDLAVKSKGVHGKIAHLLYFAADGRGETADTVVVYKGKKVVKRFNFLLQDTNPFLEYSARWKVPKKMKGKLRFCVSSTDRAGNKSNISCASLTIK